MKRFLVYVPDTPGYFVEGTSQGFPVYAKNPVEVVRKFLRNNKRFAPYEIEYAFVRDPETRRIVAKYFRPYGMRCGEVVETGGK